MTKDYVFKVGDKVRLKSGGPVMTISDTSKAAILGNHCKWFAGKKLEQGYFPSNTLEIAEDSQS